MEPVTDGELDWIRHGTTVGMTLASALPAGFGVYGVVDVEHEPTQDLALLAALEPDPGAELVAGRLARRLEDEMEPGSEHVLYAGWRYRFRRTAASDLRARALSVPAQRRFEPWEFPDLLFPADRSWLVSTLWDDSWRSIGVDEAGAQSILLALPEFERVGRDVDLRTTGRELR